MRESKSGRIKLVIVNSDAAPVVSRFKSSASKEGSIAPKKLVGVPAGNGGGNVWGFAVGAKFSVGAGRASYGAFSSLSKLMKNSVLNGAVAWNCAAFEKCGPGVPSALMIPSDSKFSTLSPPF